jgi:hypothetical protein
MKQIRKQKKKKETDQKKNRKGSTAQLGRARDPTGPIRPEPAQQPFLPLSFFLSFLSG